MTRVLHTGDTHLGYRQYHSPERRADFLRAFESVVSDAIELEVDAVVHAGDLFHDRRPDLPDLLGCLDVLRELDAADIPFLGIVGNHEMKRDSQWLDLFASMGLASRLGAEPVHVNDVAFYGLDFVPRSRRDDLEYDFETHEASHAVLVSHGLFKPLVPDYGSTEWDAAEVLDKSTVDFDAMLLGDEHAPTREEVDGTWVTYCGSTERASATERDDRGYNLVTFDEGVQITRRGIETREFVFVDLELADAEGFEQVRRRLVEYDLADAVVHVTLTGEGEDVSPARIESFATEAGALVSRVSDRREQARDPSVPAVAFADPDVAVRERIRERPMSDAAHDIDRTIRGDAVADSNVSDEVQRLVDDLLESPAKFDIPETSESDVVGGNDAEGQTDEQSNYRDQDADSADVEPGETECASASSSAHTGASETDNPEPTSTSDGLASEFEDQPADSKDTPPESGDRSSNSEDIGAESEQTARQSERSDAHVTNSDDQPDDQASMEDYL
ncbi:MAG: DNA double-strand break repair protein Mre11 [Natronomonas sp.]